MARTHFPRNTCTLLAAALFLSVLPLASAQLGSGLTLEALTPHSTADPRHDSYHHLEFRMTNFGSGPVTPEVTLDPDPATWPEVEAVYIDSDDVVGQGKSASVYLTLKLAVAGGAAGDALRQSVLSVDDGSGRSTSAAFDVDFETSAVSSVQITGTVKDVRTGQPVEGALVQWFLPSGRGPPPNTKLTTGDGKFTALAAGNVGGILVARAPGYVAYTDTDAEFVGSSTPGATAKATRAITLTPHDWTAAYRIDWTQDAGYPLYSGAATPTLDYIAVGGGEALAAGYGNAHDDAFNGKALLGMYDSEGASRWSHVAPLADRGEGGGFWAIDVTSDGFYVATGTSGGAVSLADSSGTKWTKQHTDPIHALALSPDGTLLATPGAGGDDGRSLNVYSVPSGTLAWSIKAVDVEGDPMAFAWKSDSSQLLVAADDLYLYGRDGNKIWQRTLGGGQASVLAATSDLSTIAAAGAGARLFLYGPNGDLKASKPLEYAAPEWMALSDDGARVALGTDKLIALHRADATAIWHQYVGDSTAGTISADGSYVLSATRGSINAGSSALPNGLLLFDSASNLLWYAPWGTLATYWSDDEYAQARFVAMSSDLTQIVTASTDDRVRGYTGSIQEVVPEEPVTPTPDPPTQTGEGPTGTDPGPDANNTEDDPTPGKRDKKGLPAPPAALLLVVVGLLALGARRRP